MSEDIYGTPDPDNPYDPVEHDIPYDHDVPYDHDDPGGSDDPDDLVKFFLWQFFLSGRPIVPDLLQ